MGRGIAWPEDKVREVKRLLDAGKMPREIAPVVHMPKRTIEDYRSRWNGPLRDGTREDAPRRPAVPAPTLTTPSVSDVKRDMRQLSRFLMDVAARVEREAAGLDTLEATERSVKLAERALQQVRITAAAKERIERDLSARINAVVQSDASLVSR